MANFILSRTEQLFVNTLRNHRYNINSVLRHLNHQNFSSSCINLTSRYYTRKHEWVSLNQNIATIGISDYAQKALGDVVYVQLPVVGLEVNTAEECGAIESVKAASELFSPVTGTVTEINETLEVKPELINKSCYDKGWLFKLELRSVNEIEDLLSESEYEEFIKTDAKEVET